MSRFNYLMTCVLSFFILVSPVEAQYKTDHLVFVIKDLVITKNYLESAGFIVKPGREHSNGIRNFFVKFSEGPYLEFISVTNPKDPLARFYQSLGSDKPNFVFTAYSVNGQELDSLKYLLEHDNINYFLTDFGYAEIISFPLDSQFKPYFYIRYKTCTPENEVFTIHPNSAKKIVACGYHKAQNPLNSGRLWNPAEKGKLKNVTFLTPELELVQKSLEMKNISFTFKGESLILEVSEKLEFIFKSRED